ncbi:hypothetical protein GRO01_19930 [Gluconobacter roseus NBRC 3990]|uniref:Uncharacterized protein n=1 Tax=Gluconobacter roseus NBRC 3990 TaxID=1307950 RepID=A0A4Y3M7J9_9PROT|nr:hypothetical protein AA3990_2213 [Gluconobacter roseus NBRC 3990]GEB04417.1 hypothetical protein GRO01_19930 [Gluconobacter roseus NBRC 3990]
MYKINKQIKNKNIKGNFLKNTRPSPIIHYYFLVLLSGLKYSSYCDFDSPINLSFVSALIL